MKYGIDISEHNGRLDLKSLDPAFVIIRAGYGLHYDARIWDFILQCKTLKIPYGLYWYSYALTPEDARKEVAKFNTVLLVENPDLGAWLDMEDGDGYKARHGFTFNKTNITNICNTFLDRIQIDLKGVYMSESWLKYIDTSMFNIWVASWGANTGTPPDRDFSGFYMWQFTSRLNGLNLDGDIIYGNRITNTATPKELLYMAIDTIDGLYGNGDQRKQRLGTYYETVQNLINIAYGREG